MKIRGELKSKATLQALQQLKSKIGKYAFGNSTHPSAKCRVSIGNASFSASVRKDLSGKCKCSNSQHYTPTDDDHLANLSTNNAPTHLNLTNVYTPNTVANTITLIDTGAVHESYAGT